MKITISQTTTDLLHVLLGSLWALCVCSTVVQAETQSPSSSAGTVNLLDAEVQQSLKGLPTKKIKVKQDPVYGGEQTYEGYEIRAFLAWLSQRTGVPVEKAAVTFIATDGYWSHRAVKDFPERPGVLAFREEGGSPSQPFRESLTARVPFNPGPYFLIWEGVYEERDHLPIPWSVTTVKFSSDDIPPEHLPPAGTPQLVKGMELWRTNCSRCHSINKVGGTLGPELNVPMNVTEYWDRQRLLQLIENPGSLRWGSKMPPFSWLPASDREAILGYVEAMKGKKVCQSETECNQTTAGIAK